MRVFHIAWLIILLSACGGGSGGGASSTSSSTSPPDQDNDGVADTNDVDIDGDRLIEISNLQQLDWMRHDLFGRSRNDGAGNANSSGCPSNGCNGYELIADLDFDTNGNGIADSGDTYYDYDGDGSNNGWLPIGIGGDSFDASFNGNDHTIRNLYINRPAGDAETSGQNIGLFGSINYSGANGPISINNINLVGGTVTGSLRVGSLLGVGGGTGSWTLAQCQTDIEVTGNDEVGGLAGNLGPGTRATQLQSTGSVNGTADNIGGLAGRSFAAQITQSQASGNVSTTGSYAGGLIGVQTNNAITTDNLATGSVSSLAYAGGLIGRARGSTISNNQAQGAVNATGDYAGGLVGFANGDLESVLRQNRAIGNVSGDNAVGGLVGSVNAILPSTITLRTVSVIGNFALGTVTATGNYVGGLIGISYHSNIIANFTTNSVSGNRYVGGYIGDANAGSVLIASFSTGAVTGNNDVGGFVGYSDGVTYTDNFYAADSSGQASAIGTVFGAGNVGAATDASGMALATLQCPIAENDNTCTMGATLYSNWSIYNEGNNTISYWDFGNTNQLPGLNQGGTVYRDGDGNAVLD